jgi:hypothetical protein
LDEKLRVLEYSIPDSKISSPPLSSIVTLNLASFKEKDAK